MDLICICPGGSLSSGRLPPRSLLAGILPWWTLWTNKPSLSCKPRLTHRSNRPYRTSRSCRTHCHSPFVSIVIRWLP